MKDEENRRFSECCGDDRFEIIKRAREHIIDATNIESSPEEMKVLDKFLFRCWQMDWLKNDFHQLEKENEELKAEIENLKKTYKKQRNKRIDELQKDNAELKAELDSYKALDSHYDEIEEDAKRIVVENAVLKADMEYLDKVNNEQTEVILKLNEQIEKMKNCRNCKNWNWKHSKCEKRLKGDCFKNSKWEYTE